MRKLFLLLALVPLGCGVRVVENPEPVSLSGRVTVGGKPITGVMLNLQTTGKGLPAIIPVIEGAFEAKVTPGRYAYFITRGPLAESYELIPNEFREATLDRQFDMAAGKTLDVEM